MSNTKTPTRPGQVTLAGWLIMVGSVFVVLTAFESISSLGSLDTREAVQDFLSEPPGDGLGLSVESTLQIIRIFTLVAGGCAAAAGILGFHALQRNRSARLALTILAVPLFISGIATGGFMSSLVAVSALMLWLQPSRDWFNGITPERPARASERTTPPTPPTPPTADQPPPPPASEARPYAGFGSKAGQPPSVQAPWGQPTDQKDATPAGRTGPTAPTGDRPRALVVACILTWVFAAISLLMSVASVVLMAADPRLVLDEMERQSPEMAEQGVTEQLLTTTTYALGAVVIGWCLLAIVLAVFAFRGQPWARMGLIMSTAVVVMASLIGAVGSVALLVPLAAGVATIVCLLRPEVRAWFARGR